jgi:hypothetical protein
MPIAAADRQALQKRCGERIAHEPAGLELPVARDREAFGGDAVVEVRQVFVELLRDRAAVVEDDRLIERAEIRNVFRVPRQLRVMLAVRFNS